MPADVNASLGRNFSAELKFSTRDTSAILQACKRKKFTLAAVWHAATSLATRDIQAQAEADGGGDGRDDDAYTVSNHHTVLPVVVEPGEGRTFDELAGELTAFYRRGISQPPGAWGALRPMIEEITPLFASGDMTDTTPAVSSLGNIDPYIRRRYYNSGFYTPHGVQAFHERVTQTMIEGLGLYEQARL
ncbi:hypothetical protein DL770_002623 [Monosporascus sp. CRB-9-2]|nr:hypothetical protein DL770_002623 [Monosporascus sp. CRB-9-2]